LGEGSHAAAAAEWNLPEEYGQCAADGKANANDSQYWYYDANQVVAGCCAVMTENSRCKPKETPHLRAAFEVSSVEAIYAFESRLSYQIFTSLSP
jgi:hypothetical protein